MPEKNLLDSAYDYLVDASGEYVTVTDTATTGLDTRRAALYTAKDGLTSRDAHILATSTGTAVFSRMFGVDIMAHGGDVAYSSPRAALYTRRDSTVVDTTRTILPGVYGTTRYGYSAYQTALTGDAHYGQSTYGTGHYY